MPADVINIPARENSLLPLLLQLQHSKYEDQLSQARLAMLPLQMQQQAVELQLRQQALDESLDPNSPHNQLLLAQVQGEKAKQGFYSQQANQSGQAFPLEQRERASKADTAESEATRAKFLSSPESLDALKKQSQAQLDEILQRTATAKSTIEHQTATLDQLKQEQDRAYIQNLTQTALSGPSGLELARNAGNMPGASPAIKAFVAGLPDTIDFPSINTAAASTISQGFRSSDPEQQKSAEKLLEGGLGIHADPYAGLAGQQKASLGKTMQAYLTRGQGGGTGAFSGPPTPGSVPTQAGVQPAPVSGKKGPFSDLPYRPDLKASPVVDKLAGSLEGFGSLGLTPLGSIQETASGDGPAAKKAKEFLSVKGSMFRDESQEGFIARMTKISGGTDKAKAIERFYTEDRAASGTSHTLYKGLLTDLFQSKTDEERAKAVEDLKAKYGNQALTPTQWGSLKSMSGFMGWDI